MTDLYVKRVERRDLRLGRVVVHDEASRRFAVNATVDTATWNTRVIRLYDPLPNPSQCHGECTGCDSAMGFNAVGNRVRGRVLNMDDAHRIYSLATTLDPWEGSWPEYDTGSSGLAAAKAAQQLGLGGEYLWHFGGVDEVVQSIMDGHTVGVGTWWFDGMFEPDKDGFIWPTGRLAGGHQYRARAYYEALDAVGVRCWWGDGFRDVKIKREVLGELLADDGDSVRQERLQP